MEPGQALRVLEFCYRPDSYNYFMMYCSIQIAVACTLRGGEIGALQWDRVNFDKQLLKIDRTIDRVDRTNLNLPKMNVIYLFPNLYPGTKSLIVLKQPKSNDSIRDVDVPLNVLNSLQILKNMQDTLKTEFGPEGYCDYNLVICQANCRPLMTEHLNKRFKDILVEMNDPEINPKEIVFHSHRHTSATAKLILSNGDYNSVMHAGGWANLDMLTRRYGKHSFASDREKLSDKMNDFLNGKTKAEPNTQDTEVQQKLLQDLLKTNPDFLIQLVRLFQSINT